MNDITIFVMASKSNNEIDVITRKCEYYESTNEKYWAGPKKSDGLIYWSPPFESNGIKYWLGSGYWDFKWMGKYTHGYSGVRGTKIWLTKHAGKSYNLNGTSSGWRVEKDNEQDEMNGNHAINIYNDWDTYAIRSHSPTECLNTEWFKVVTHDQLCEIWDDYNNRREMPALPEFNHRYQIINEEGAGEMIWYVIYARRKMKIELALVEKIGISEGVNFTWV
jgi:hypothetical protein